jgi:hypothetical protein
MIRAVNVTYALGMAIVASTTMVHAAPGPTAELAKKCRELMIKAYPGKENAQEQRQYFKTCLAQGGKMENPDTPTKGRSK